MIKFPAVLAASLALSLSFGAAQAAECADSAAGGQKTAEVRKDGGAAPLQDAKGQAGVTETEQGKTENYDKAKKEAESNAAHKGSSDKQAKSKDC